MSSIQCVGTVLTVFGNPDSAKLIKKIITVFIDC